MKNDIILITAIAAVVLLSGLGSGSLSSWDEAFYAQVSREMEMSNNWIDLTWGDAPWSDKPPLYMWGTVLFYKIFGVNEFSARLFSALAGIFTALVTYLLARKLFSRREGILSAIMLLSTYHFFWFARSGTLDVTFTLFVLLSVYFFMSSDTDRRNIIYSALFFGLAFLTKGIGAFIIPLIMIPYIAITRRWDMISDRYTLMGAVLFVATVGIWYSAAFMHYGASFFEGNIIKHLITRTTGTVDGHYGNWLAYVNTVLYKGKPWGAVGLMALPFFIYGSIREHKASGWILISWIFMTLLVFSSIRTKLHWYIMPVYPAVIIVAGWGVSRLLKKRALFTVAACAAAMILYFGSKKGLFALDFNPEIKAFSVATADNIADGEKMYLYGVGDPGVRFYLGGHGKNLNSEKELEQALSENSGIVIVGETSMFEEKGLRGEILAMGPGRIRAVRMER
ncbi:MAG: glycosyltransferase family 39 protein [Candidatus Omnitrophota bacterium]|nr:glycosyltransferase family 39 protein [Candidatus Omnitrophota bacterium]